MKERLIEMIQSAVGDCAKYWAEVIADKLIAEGVIVPPCKVGDTVHVSNISCMPCHKITEAVKGKAIRYVFNNAGFFCVNVSLENGFNWRYLCDDFGKTVFLTREEAEKHLRKEGIRNEIC